MKTGKPRKTRRQKISGIYSITQISTNNKYLCSSIDCTTHYVETRRSLQNNIFYNQPLQDAWNNCGEDDFVIEILEENILRKDLRSKKNEYMIKFGLITEKTKKVIPDFSFNEKTVVLVDNTYIKEKVSGVYSITQISTGKRYIGSSVNISGRWGEHIRLLRNDNHYNVYLQNTWNKYGENDFAFEIIEGNISQELLDDAENNYMVQFGIAEVELDKFFKEFGFNMCWAGREGCVDPGNHKKGEDHHSYGKVSPMKGKTFSEEAKKNMSTGQKGKKYPGRKGVPLSDDTKGKLREKMKGKPWTQARREAQDSKNK